MSWPMTQLGEVTKIISGSTPKTGKDEFWDGDIPWVTPKDLSSLNSKSISSGTRNITRQGMDSCSTTLLPEGSVLFSSRAPIGLVAINEIPMCTNQGFKSFVPEKDKVFPDYLYWWLKAHRRQLEQLGRGATFKEVSKKVIAEVSFPLPPLEEQKRIAKILDAADALRAKRRKSLAQLDALLQSTFLDLFGDPASLNGSGEKAPLKDFVKLENGDRSSNYPSGDEILSEGILFLSTKNIVSDKLNLAKCNFISRSKFDSLSRGKLCRGDLVITLRGTLGSCAIFDCDFDTGFINAQMLILRPLVGVLPEYIHGLLTTRSMKKEFEKLATGVAVKQLTAKQIGDLQVPVPTIDEQQEYAVLVDRINKQKLQLLSHERCLEALFRSLQHRAFSGEL